MYGAMFSYNQMFCFPFIIIYSVVNSYIVNKTLKCMEAQPPEIERHKMETEDLRKPGDSSSSVQGQPLILKLEVMGFALGNTTITVEVVYPMHAYDCWWASFVGRPP